MSRIIAVDRKREIMSACLLGVATFSQPAISYALKETDHRNVGVKPLVVRSTPIRQITRRPEYRYGAERTWPSPFEASEEESVAVNIHGRPLDMVLDQSLFVTLVDNFPSPKHGASADLDLLTPGLVIAPPPYKDLGSTAVMASYTGPLKPRDIGEDEDEWF